MSETEFNIEEHPIEASDAKDNDKAVDKTLIDIQKRIRESFDVFDHESNGTVDVREVGTILRSLRCCPTEGELHDIIAEVEEEEPTGYIQLDKFLPFMTNALMERKYRANAEEELYKALQSLDEDKKGHLTIEEMTKYMTEEGEPFTQDELEEMLTACVDPDKGTINYREYSIMLAVDET